MKTYNIAAYYKSNETGGFGIDALSLGEAYVEPLAQACASVEESVSDWMKMSGTSKADIASDMVEQTTEICVWLNNHIFGSQLKSPVVGEFQINHCEDLTKALFIFFTNVQWLQTNGFLVSNEHNGMLYINKVK